MAFLRTVKLTLSNQNGISCSMIRGGKERTQSTPPGVDERRRRLLVRIVRLAGAGAGIYALSKTKPGYAAVKTAVHFRERRKSVNPATTPSLDAQTTKFDLSQGQPGTIQDTTTPDATVTALQKRVLQDQAQQLENQPGWLETNIATLIGSLSTTLALVGVGYTIWDGQRKIREDNNDRLEAENNDRKKRDEDRFQTFVSGLASNDIATKTVAAHFMRTFLDPQNKESCNRFYELIFELAVNHLRGRDVDKTQVEREPKQFYKEIIKLFMQSAPLVVENLRDKEKIDLKSLSESDHDKFEDVRRKYLNASGVHLDGANLIGAALNYIDLSKATLIVADLKGADLKGADLSDAKLSGAKNLTQQQLDQVYTCKDAALPPELTCHHDQ